MQLQVFPYMGVGRNLAYKKELFYRHKGFSSHNHIPGGDDDLFIIWLLTAKIPPWYWIMKHLHYQYRNQIFSRW
jgi:hypothetical protein